MKKTKTHICCNRCGIKLRINIVKHYEIAHNFYYDKPGGIWIDGQRTLIIK